MRRDTQKIELRPIGLLALLQETGQHFPRPFEAHYAGGVRKVFQSSDTQSETRIPNARAPVSTRQHLEYALTKEPLDLRAWFQIVHALGPNPFRDWVIDQPTGRYSRKAWYLFESLTGTTIDVPEPSVSNYVQLANPDLQLTTTMSVRSHRHRVDNNLLGDFRFCPLVRWTPNLRRLVQSNLHQRVQSCIVGVELRDLQRATDYLYRKETRASFQIERETVTSDRIERFVQILQTAPETLEFSEKDLTKIQNAIVEPRYAESGFREIQNFVGQMMPWGEEKVHYPCPLPTALPSLMEGWQACFERTSEVDAVCQAAVLGFGFVFIHPFIDGNGRIHRYVIHSALSRRKFTPSNIVLPISATMLRRRDRYDAALEAHSQRVTPYVNFRLDTEKSMIVESDSTYLYRYWDATPQCEYLYEAISDTVNVDLPEELKALKAFDAGFSALTSIVDMPDRRARLLLKFLLQNEYKLSKSKRDSFPELSDAEVKDIEQAVQDAIFSERGNSSVLFD